MTPLRPALAPVLAALALAACSRAAPDPAPAPDSAPPPVRVMVETVTVRDRELDQRAARLDIQLMDKEAQIEDLQARLDDARREVVRSMAKVQTLATRAEAASGMAEAEIALQTLRRSLGNRTSAGEVKAGKLLQDATGEFNRQNYGGALWLANQAKTMAGADRGRLSGGDSVTLRPGEMMFAVPPRMQAVGRTKVREGPGTGYRTLMTVEGGTPLTGYSYLEQWMRVADDSGRMGWVFYSLVRRRQGTAR